MQNKYRMRRLLLLGTVLLVGCADTTEDSQDSNGVMDETEEIIPENDEGTETDEPTVEEDPADEYETETIEFTSDVEAQYTTSLNQALLDAHSQRHQEIEEELTDGNYTFEDPLVTVDPYGRSPLAALVSFESEEIYEVTVTVEGDTEVTTISHTYILPEREMHIPVLGLYPNRENQVTIAARTEAGEILETSVTATTSSLPDDLLEFTVDAADPDRMAEGLTFIQPSYYPTAVDSNGDVRWFSPVKTYNQLKRLENGHMLLATLEEDREEYDHLTEMDMVGRVHQSITIDMENVIDSPPLHHDTIILPNDNYLALLHDGSEEYVEDELAEIDKETGEVVHRINFKDIFPEEMYLEYSGHNEDVGDWLHINTVWKLEDEDALLLSLRNQDVILKLSYPEPEIEWLMEPTEGWHADVQEYVLEPVDESIVFHTGPHAVEEMPDQDGNEDTIDMMLFDNNRVYTRGDLELSEQYSRGVQFRINEAEGTVEEIWSYGEERGTDFYSRIVGDADYLEESDTVLLASGHVLDEAANQRNSIIVEVTKTDEPEVVFEMWYGPFGANEYFQTYRAERIPLYPEN